MIYLACQVVNSN
jgi:hypothetical protein